MSWRMASKTTVPVEEDRPIQPPLPDGDGGRIAVVADQRVTLSSPNNHTSVVLPGFDLPPHSPT